MTTPRENLLKERRGVPSRRMPRMRESLRPAEFAHDESRWPLVRVTCPKAEVDVTSLESHLRYLDSVLARRRPYVLVIDARGSAPMDARSRDRMRQHRMANNEAMGQLQRGVAIVVDCTLQRAIMGAILAVSPGPWRDMIFDSMPEAERWASECLTATREERGVGGEQVGAGSDG
jgi:hypothetical protein